VYNGKLLRSKGLKDTTCVVWFGDDWDCSVGSPPEAMITRVGRYQLPTLITSKSLMVRATSECSDRSKRGELQRGALKQLRFGLFDSESPGWKLQVLD